ncbi:MAG TPA: sodium:alanine symporter family protein [Dehalococcoidia bacterium]|nr:sodium:alanine symporter family protein [Dehalococcoidia bacterium]
MEAVNNLLNSINGIVWGVPMIIAILGTGLFLQYRLRLMPIFRIGTGFKLLWGGRRAGPESEGEISPFAALMTALAATVGTGNIVGVATAMALGGPGALFWMWMTALVGMATKYCEVVLAVQYREVDEKGEHIGGPMYAIKNGLGTKWAWLGTAFALFGGIAGFGIGNMVQANSISSVMQASFGAPVWATGLVLTALTGLVILGGIKRIGRVAEALVPSMILVYVVSTLYILITHAGAIPAALGLIVTHAFTPVAATGGFAGAAVWAALRYGVARGIFSNEAGLGTAGIAQAAGTTTSSVRSGLIGMLGTFIDTLIVCSMTGLAIIVTGVWTSGKSGAELSSMAYEAGIPGIGASLLAVELAIFAFTTILGWSYYGEKCWEFLIGSTKFEKPYRWIWTAVVFVGAVAQLNFVWLVADTLNALMALPNLLSLILLSPVVIQLTREYFARSPGLAAVVH